MHKYHIFLLSFLLGSCHVGEEYHHTEIITPYDVQENLNELSTCPIYSKSSWVSSSKP